MIGLGTYAFFWQHSDRVEEPLSLIGAFEATRELGIGLFQICDFAPLETMGDNEVREAAKTARDLDLAIELGTKGLEPERLQRFLHLAEAFDAKLVRSMVHGPGPRATLAEAQRSTAYSPGSRLMLSDPGQSADYRPGPRSTLAEAEQRLRAALPAYEAAGVTLALETYEQVATADLVSLVERIDSPHLGICLDPANVVARLESPRDTVELAAPHVKNVHAKDFAFARQPGWVGFTYSGARMGEGLHDYRHLLAHVRPRARGVNEIVEHWLPWQGDPATTVRTERDWTRATVDHLKSAP